MPGLCPCCNDWDNSTLTQSIHSTGIFNSICKRGNFKRDYLFCTKCIDWAKAEMSRARDRPVPPQDLEIPQIAQNPAAVAQLPEAGPSGGPVGLPQVAQNPQYSPIR